MEEDVKRSLSEQQIKHHRVRASNIKLCPSIAQLLDVNLRLKLHSFKSERSTQMEKLPLLCKVSRFSFLLSSFFAKTVNEFWQKISAIDVR